MTTTKSKADTWFSRFIRLKYSTESNGTLFVRCCTCGDYREAKHVDCGHYQKRQHMATRFDERNVGPQCKLKCNNFEQGDPEKMAKWIDKTHGEGTSEALRLKSKMIVKANDLWLKVIADDYKSKTLELLEERGWKKYVWW